MKHVGDIAEKYLIPGETQDTALMFVPSESVYAEIHDGFDDIVQKAYRARVVLVSPSLLMLAIQVMQQIARVCADARCGRPDPHRGHEHDRATLSGCATASASSAAISTRSARTFARC